MHDINTCILKAWSPRSHNDRKRTACEHVLNLSKDCLVSYGCNDCEERSFTSDTCNDMLIAIKSSQDQSRKHVLR